MVAGPPQTDDPTRFWLSAGAKPTDKVAQLLGQAGVTPMVPEPPRYKPLDPANATKWMKADK
jgi:ribosomal protein S16